MFSLPCNEDVAGMFIISNSSVRAFSYKEFQFFALSPSFLSILPLHESAQAADQLPSM